MHAVMGLLGSLSIPIDSKSGSTFIRSLAQTAPIPVDYFSYYFLTLVRNKVFYVQKKYFNNNIVNMYTNPKLLLLYLPVHRITYVIGF